MMSSSLRNNQNSPQTERMSFCPTNYKAHRTRGARSGWFQRGLPPVPGLEAGASHGRTDPCSRSTAARPTSAAALHRHPQGRPALKRQSVLHCDCTVLPQQGGDGIRNGMGAGKGCRGKGTEGQGPQGPSPTCPEPAVPGRRAAACLRATAVQHPPSGLGVTCARWTPPGCPAPRLGLARALPPTGPAERRGGKLAAMRTAGSSPQVEFSRQNPFSWLSAHG